MPYGHPRTPISLLFMILAACTSSSSDTPASQGGNTGGTSTGGTSTGGTSTGGTSTGGTSTGGTSTGGTTGDGGDDTTGATNVGTMDSGMRADGGGNTSGTGADATVDSGPPLPTCDASKAPAVGKLGLTQVVGSVGDLVNAAQPPGSSDWYLVRRNGRIEVFTGGAVRRAPFLDLSGEITLSGDSDERGLLGLTFHPDYASNGSFYVMMTTPNNVDQVREYKRSGADAFAADANSKRDIVVLPSSASNHNGGTVLFGPDGLLYVGTGDGGGQCNSNQPGAPQNVGSLFGMILRLDVSKSSPFAADGNPFAADGDARVLHYGLRNPFRFGFDRATGDLYIGDVGQSSFEEIDFAAKGASGLNFGWPDFEAEASETCSSAASLRANSTHTKPIMIAKRGSGSDPFNDYRSIVGGIVYRGTALPTLQGMYFFGDYFGDRMGALYQCGTQTSEITEITKGCDINAPTEACFAAKGGIRSLNTLAAIIEGSDGEMYFVANREALYKVVPN